MMAINLTVLTDTQILNMHNSAATDEERRKYEEELIRRDVTVERNYELIVNEVVWFCWIKRIPPTPMGSYAWGVSHARGGSGGGFTSSWSKAEGAVESYCKRNTL